MAYRDERDALRARNQELERALREARGELEQLRSARISLSEPERDDDAPLAKRVPSASLPLGKIGAALAALTVVLVFVGMLPLALGVVPVLAFVTLLAALQSTLHIARPNELLVVSGGTDPTTGRRFRVCRGRTFTRPFVETTRRIDLRVFPVGIGIVKAETKSNPVDVELLALAKLSGDEAGAINAVERFLGMPHHHIAEVVGQTLEGAAREVITAFTPRQLSAERSLVAERIAEAAADDLGQLGVELRTLRLLQLRDGDGELDGGAHEHIAQVLRDHHITESEQKR